VGIPTQTQSRRIRGILLVLLATAFWATSGIFVSLTAQNWDISPVSLAFWRDLTTFTVLFAGTALLKPGLLRINLRDLPWLLAMGAISIGAFHVLWNTSVLLIGAAAATVIQCNAPIFVTIMAWILFKEALTSHKVIAIAFSIAGTVLISGILGTSLVQLSKLGVLTALLSGVFYGSFSLFGKRLTGKYNPWTILLYIFGFGALILLPFQVLNPSSFPYAPPALYYFAGLILISTISGFAIYTTALVGLQASIASITATSEIIFAALLAYFILGERLDIWQIFGAAMIVSGVVLVSLPNGNRKEGKDTTLLLGIDTGGTYTDGVLLDESTRQVVATTKILTTKHDLSICILQALDDLLPEDPGQVGLVSISTTLATNAIAEGKGRPVALFLLGYDPELVKQFHLEGHFATSSFHYFQGGHNLHGEEQNPLDLDVLLAKADALKQDVDAFAISGYFSPFNASHEERAFQAITDSTGLPVVLGHQLSRKLNSIQRATTASLNASLLSILQDFIQAMRESLRERKITAPLMIVRGDGALMEGAVGAQRPVETVHSGPAASAIGGRFLVQRDPALVIDIGGTTTDIAVIDQGGVAVSEEGTSVGSYRTAVRAARVRSLGLGGDSFIGFDLEDHLTVGPVRVTPISYLAHSNPRVAQDLKRLPHRQYKKLSVDNLEYWFLQREPRRPIQNERAREVLDMLRPGPMALPDILERMGLYHPLQFSGQTLISQEIIGRAAFTPTDLLHVNGAYAPWDVDAAETAAWLMSRISGMTVNELVDEVMRIIAERITAEVVSFLSTKTLERTPEYIHPDDLGLWLFEENLYQKHPYLGSQINLKIPIIGIGAPAKIFLPRVAAMLHTDLVIPDHFQVANAVGAVAGSVMTYEEAWIIPKSHGMYIAGYYVQSEGERVQFSKLEAALEHARTITGERALKRARLSGAVNPHLEIDQLPDGVESYRIRARAVGNPRLMK
jgi:N-methylhydantoinase A/oxoprolinase/acetone carboxylase beta subunit/drug/metabolite transporter (DMT)-like permease